MILKIISVLTLIYLPLFVEAIFGGKDVTNPHQYPWIVKIQSWFDDPNQGGFCGGSIISKTMVMTAAHCVKKENGNIATRTVITLGHSNFNSDECLTVVVEAIKIHPQAFNETTRKWGNDIALLQLSKELQFKKSIQPIGLPNRNYTDAILLDTSKTKLIAAAWGRSFQISEEEVKPYKDKGFNTAQKIKEFYKWHKKFLKKAKRTNNLKFLELYYRNPEECIRIRKIRFPLFEKNVNTDELKSGIICASGKVPEIQSTCHGDSGGPLMRQDMDTGDIQVIGIITNGFGCSSIVPNLFTKVSKHVSWIHENSKLSRRGPLLIQ